MRGPDWIELMLPARCELQAAPDPVRARAVREVRRELAGDLAQAGLPALFLPPGSHLIQGPCAYLDLMLPCQLIAGARTVLGRACQPCEEGLLHLSGLTVRLHGELPGGPGWEEAWGRSLPLSEAPGRRPDDVDSLWLGALVASLYGSPGWTCVASRLLASEEVSAGLEERGTDAAAPALLAVLKLLGRNGERPPTSKLAQDLILRRLARHTGMGGLPAVVGWLPTLRFRFFPTPSYLIWVYRVRRPWLTPLYYGYRWLQALAGPWLSSSPSQT